MQKIAVLLKYLFLFVCIVKLITVRGCGITTHTEIGHRAVSYFHSPEQYDVDYKQLIQEHQDAFQAGNPYPDSFYSSVCQNGVFHDVSEDTHWSPFLSATLTYIRTNYPRPWNDETKKLVVFMLGFVSHQVADVSWHSLGIDQGFLSTMGMTDFHGSFDNAHTAGDIGGDIVNQFEISLDYFNITAPWYVPVGDLYNIYQLYYSGKSNMTRQVIEDCTLIMFLARYGEQIAVKKLFPFYANKSPFLVNQLSDYFLGGMNDMAVWTTNIWNQAIHILHEGTGSCSVPRNPLYIRCNKTRQGLKETEKAGNTLRNGFFIQPNLHGLSKRDVDITRTQRGLYFNPKPHLQDLVRKLQEKSAQRLYPKKVDSSCKPVPRIMPDTVYKTREPYADLGRSLISADFNGDGYADLAVSAPGHNAGLGRVYIVYGTQHGLPALSTSIEKACNDSRQGLELNGKFGWSLAVVDLNCDGLSDLAVSAPSVGSTNLTYQGEVYVYFNHGHHGLSPKPDLTVTCQDKYCNLGWSLTGGDLNRDGNADLIIGSPYAPAGGEQRGMVGVIYAKKTFDKTTLTVDDFDWLNKGDQNYAWYGYSVGVKRTSFSGTWLMVGSPTYRKCSRPDCSFSEDDVQRVGMLLVYDQLLPSHKPRHVFTGKSEFENLGTSFAVGDPFEKYTDMLAISQTGLSVNGVVGDHETYMPQIGGVSVYNVSVLLRNVQYRSVMFYGDRLYDKFGSKVMFTDLLGQGLDDLIITSPLRTTDPTEELQGAEEGTAFLYKHTNQSMDRYFPIYNATFERCDQELIKPCPGHIADAILVFGEERARFGTAMTRVPSQHASAVAITASHSSQSGARLSGAVAIYTFTETGDC